MHKSTVIKGQELDRQRLYVIFGLLVVLVLGIFLRFYKLNTQLLWLDELYTAELVDNGLDQIWRTALVDVLPPLSTLPFWLAGRIGGITAQNLRMVSAIASTIALLAFSKYAFMVQKPGTALISVGLFAIAPLAIYYSQEARPYGLGLMGIVLSLLAFEHLRRHDSITNWIIYILMASVASQFYNLIPVLIGGQLITLLILAENRKRVLLGSLMTVVTITLTLGPFTIGAFNVVTGWKYYPHHLGFLSSIKTLLAGDVRFASPLVRFAALATAFLGFILAVSDRHSWRPLLPHALQITLVFVVTFLILPLVGMQAPAYDERAFLMLLPSIIIIISIGIQNMMDRKSGQLIAVILTVMICTSSFVSLFNYFFHFSKSPEGQLAKLISTAANHDDKVITHIDAYSVEAALRFYSPELRIYRFQRENNGYLFVIRDPSILIINQSTQNEIEFSQQIQNNRFWFIHRSSNPSYLESLLNEYEVLENLSVAPFNALLLQIH